MIKTVFLAFCFSIMAFANAQKPKWDWVKPAGCAEFDYGDCICTDNKGYVYVGGALGRGGFTIGNVKLTSVGNSDILLVCYDGAGNMIWVNKAGGKYDDQTMAIATDMERNIYVTGFFNSDTLSFGSTQLINKKKGKNETGDIFIAKYDSLGNLVWARSAGGTR